MRPNHLLFLKRFDLTIQELDNDKAVISRRVHIEGIIEADTLAGENTLAGILVSDETTSYTMYCYFDGPDTRSVYEEKKKAGDSASMTVWLFDGGSKDHPSYYGIIVDLK